jgi:hypothetical protein
LDKIVAQQWLWITLVQHLPTLHGVSVAGFISVFSRPVGIQKWNQLLKRSGFENV